MKLFDLHLTIRAIALSIVFFHATGFTTVVRYCTMSQSSECCCNSESGDSDATGPNAPALTVQNPGCFSVTVLGGLSDIKGVFSPESSSKSPAPSALTLDHQAVPQLTSASPAALSSQDNAALPDTDICIRIGTLLI
jgi:hypothetical protein